MASWQCGEEMLAMFAELHAQEDACRFVLMVPEAEHEKVRQAATNADLREDAYVLKEVTHSEVASELSKCHVGVLLRKDDIVNRVSSPTKFAEYLAAGLPVLLSDCIGDYSETARKLSAGHILCADVLSSENYDPNVIAGVLEFAKASRDKRYEVRLRTQRLVRAELEWESLSNRWISGY